MTAILITQVLTMFLLAAIGMIMFKKNKITMEGSKTIANLLIFLSLPSVIIQGFLVERDALHIQMLLYSILAAVAMTVIAIIVSRLLFHNDPTAHFAAACPTGSNIAMYAQLYDQDYPYAVETVVISTLLCIVSMPAIVMLAQMLWG